MVKAEMGPEAIIIAARDNSKRYGLVGEGSVEITAAIQQQSLQKKMVVEARMPADVRDKLHRGSAKAHRELIEKATARKDAPIVPAKTTIPVAKSTGPVNRSQRYIDMEDDVEPAAAPNGANEKLKVAAQKAWKAMQAERALAEKTMADKSAAARGATVDPQLQVLQSEISSLKEIFKNFENVPQTIIKGHPGSEYGLRYELAPMYEKLLGAGLTKSLAVEILKEVQEKLPESSYKQTSFIHGLIAQALANRLEVASSSASSKVEVFIGAGGHGKTSTLIKMAAHLAMNEHKRVAILTTDTQKFGASEQLKIYAQILNIPFMVVSDYSQWEVVAEESAHFDKILVDSPGVRFRNSDELQKLKQLLPPGYLKPVVHLVISATSKDQDAIELGKRFASIGFDDVIFTALDESFQHGVLVNFQASVGKPFHSFGIGPRVPEDFESATKERIIDLLLGHQSETNFSYQMDL